MIFKTSHHFPHNAVHGKSKFHILREKLDPFDWELITSLNVYKLRCSEKLMRYYKNGRRQTF
jgi:hypothetical protein